MARDHFGIIMTMKKGLLFLEPFKLRNPEIVLLVFTPHWCMLHFFWSNLELHPPKSACLQDYIPTLHTVCITIVHNSIDPIQTLPVSLSWIVLPLAPGTCF
jgi:hypothetical protein